MILPFSNRILGYRVFGSFMYPKRPGCRPASAAARHAGFPVAGGTQGPGRISGLVRRHFRGMRVGVLVLVWVQGGLAVHGVPRSPCDWPFIAADEMEASPDLWVAGGWLHRFSPLSTWILRRAARGAWRRGWCIGGPRCKPSVNILFSHRARHFWAVYKQIKPPNAEWARLTHNDYLEQATDSGIIGFLAFAGLIVGLMAYLYRYRFQKIGHDNMVRFAVWLGLLGLFLHSGMEFNLVLSGIGLACIFSVGLALGIWRSEVILIIITQSAFCRRYRYRFSALA